MSSTKQVLAGVALLFLTACNRGLPRKAADARPASTASVSSLEHAPPSQVVVPTRLLSLPVSAYAIRLGLDGEVAYLLTRTAGYRLQAGRPPDKLELDFGVGPVLAASGIVFWSKGAVWNAAKTSKAVWHVAEVAKQPEYFVASDAGFAWLDRAGDGPYRIQTVQDKKPRVLFAASDELSAVHMIHQWIYFVQREPGKSWRIGRVAMAGGEPQYSSPRTGPTPAMLTGRESPMYYDMERSAVLELTPELSSEHAWLKDFVCTPIFAARNVYCGRVEGLFEIVAETTAPKGLSFGRHETITAISANAQQVVWTVDTGPDKLAVDMLPVLP
jgi:hypothetical protein